MGNKSTAAELLKRSLNTFLAKDMKGWSDLCEENVLVEFPFAPEGSPRRLEGRRAITNICGVILTLSISTASPQPASIRPTTPMSRSRTGASRGGSSAMAIPTT